MNFLTYIDAHRSILIMGAERNDGLLEIGIAYAGHGQQQVYGIKGGHIPSATTLGVRGLSPTMLGGSPAIRHKRARHIFYATATVGLTTPRPATASAAHSPQERTFPHPRAK